MTEAERIAVGIKAAMAAAEGGEDAVRKLFELFVVEAQRMTREHDRWLADWLAQLPPDTHPKAVADLVRLNEHWGWCYRQRYGQERPS